MRAMPNFPFRAAKRACHGEEPRKARDPAPAWFMGSLTSPPTPPKLLAITLGFFEKA